MTTLKVTLQPWLLQHFTGTTGFRVELLLANMVAEKYKSMYEVDLFLDFHISEFFLYVQVDWVEVLTSVKEFSGHTYSSLRAIYMSRLVRNAKMKLNVESVTPLQVRMMMQKVSKGCSVKDI